MDVLAQGGQGQVRLAEARLDALEVAALRQRRQRRELTQDRLKQLVALLVADVGRDVVDGEFQRRGSLGQQLLEVIGSVT